MFVCLCVCVFCFDLLSFLTLVVIFFITFALLSDLDGPFIVAPLLLNVGGDRMAEWAWLCNELIMYVVTLLICPLPWKIHYGFVHHSAITTSLFKISIK